MPESISFDGAWKEWSEQKNRSPRKIEGGRLGKRGEKNSLFLGELGENRGVLLGKQIRRSWKATKP